MSNYSGYVVEYVINGGARRDHHSADEHEVGDSGRLYLKRGGKEVAIYAGGSWVRFWFTNAEPAPAAEAAE